MGGGKKNFYMGERFVDCPPLVPLPRISCKDDSVENKLVCIFDHLLGGVGRGAGIGVRNCVIDIPPEYLDGFCGGVCLAEALVV